MTKMKINIERKVITYSDFWKTSKYFLEKGQKDEVGSYFHFLGCLIFSAFAFEAFLNHLGEHEFDCWNEIERKLSPRSKLSLIAERLNIDVNYGKMPWQILPELLGFRDKVAHGKNDMLRLEQIVPADKYEKVMYQILESDWQAYATNENAIKVHKHLLAVFEHLHASANIKDDRLFDWGSQTRRSSPVKP